MILIGYIALLPRLFERVLLPEAVYDELRQEGAPPEVRQWVSHMPEWAEVRRVESADQNPTLDRGEREAIELAVSLSADAILVDERRGRQSAHERGLFVIGTLGILDRAARMGWVELPEALSRLQQTSFHADPKLIQTLLQG